MEVAICNLCKREYKSEADIHFVKEVQKKDPEGCPCPIIHCHGNMIIEVR